jgi:hypothetical protein
MTIKGFTIRIVMVLKLGQGNVLQITFTLTNSLNEIFSFPYFHIKDVKAPIKTQTRY